MYIYFYLVHKILYILLHCLESVQMFSTYLVRVVFFISNLNCIIILYPLWKKFISNGSEDIWTITSRPHNLFDSNTFKHSKPASLSSHQRLANYVARPASFFRRSLPSMYVSFRTRSPFLRNILALSRAIIILHRQEYDFYRGKDTSPTTDLEQVLLVKITRNERIWVIGLFKKKKVNTTRERVKITVGW